MNDQFVILKETKWIEESLIDSSFVGMTNCDIYLEKICASVVKKYNYEKKYRFIVVDNCRMRW